MSSISTHKQSEQKYYYRVPDTAKKKYEERRGRMGQNVRPGGMNNHMRKHLLGWGVAAPLRVFSISLRHISKTLATHISMVNWVLGVTK